jgi:Phosphotransferase enzyme family
LTLPWDAAGWQEAVGAWIDETLAELHVERVGRVDHFRQRPWAALARVSTAQGDIYFKADAPSEAYEPALTEWLAGRRPDLVPDVLGIDANRGWLLTRNAGKSLLDEIADPPDPAIWSQLLPLCAELQIELASSVDELLVLGVPDSRPELLGQVYEDLLARRPESESAPTAAEIAQLIEGLGDTIPASLTHEEFQDHNILLRDGDPVVIDWAEAVIEHPFCGLVNTFRGLVSRWGLEPVSSSLLDLRDAYLEPWTSFAPPSRLVELFELAYPLGMLCRALSWDRLLAGLPEHDLSEYEPFVPAWLDMASDTLEGKATLGT